MDRLFYKRIGSLLAETVCSKVVQVILGIFVADDLAAADLVLVAIAGMPVALAFSGSCQRAPASLLRTAEC